MGAFFLYFLFLGSALLGDTITVKETGRKFYGKIFYMTNDELWLDVGKGKIMFKLSDITYEINNKYPKNLKPKLSVVKIPVVSGEEGAKEQPKGEEGTAKKSSSSSKSSGAAKSKKPKNNEKVDPIELSRMKVWIGRLQRMRSVDRRKAMGQCKIYVRKYPLTMIDLLLPKLTPNAPANVLVRYLDILSEIGKPIDHLELREKLIIFFLKHKDKLVRYYTARALKVLTGQNIDYPEPSSGLDQSITSEEKIAIEKWQKWWNEYQTKKIQEELEKEKASKKTTDKETEELLKKLKKLLKE
ncbi:MAG: hypothetical protein D6785_02745 [Planctomycetota bacterium]|nr:MAG: hypothetical protein D6785_02745 [Planctomycetota bacterium]